MKRILLSLVSLVCMIFISKAQWQPAGDKIKTEWATQVNPQNVLPEYPRPIMERQEWMNLNGLWDYSILPVAESLPSAWQGKILVPFAVESSLSGIQKPVGEENALWYERKFSISSKWKGQQVLLHFDAVNWKAEVWINDIKIGVHEGGYTPFSFNITPYLNSAGEQKLSLKVWNPVDKGTQPRGKQVSKPEGIWYTAVTGIWQTVWLEPVSEAYISNLKTYSDIDSKKITVTAEVAGMQYGDVVRVKLSDNGQVVQEGKAAAGQEVSLALADIKLWSPENPYLYSMEAELIRNGKVIDKVKSYAAMRKISTKRDANNIVRYRLNNKDYFQFGPLDQGWWPDGLYTAPTDDALKFGVQKTKEMGFNMIRKHVKVEPARWYTWCDKLGILVWQDMPSGDDSPEWITDRYFDGGEFIRSAESEAIYRREWKEIMDAHMSYPCIVTWVPFNESWGQFKTPEIVAWTKAYDPSRLVDPASGGNHYHAGDMLDLHNYPEPKLYFYDGNRPTVLGEFGGIGLAVENHLWFKDRNWGYVEFKTSKEATDEFVKFTDQLVSLIKSGFSAAVYTQTTDVEGEVNGLMTYDRMVMKMDLDRLKDATRKVRISLDK